MKLQVIAATLSVTLFAGCYTTSLQGGRIAPLTEIHEERQWFLFGGWTALSQPNATECKYGIARAQTEISAADAGIILLESIAGAASGFFICYDPGNRDAGANCAVDAAVTAAIFSIQPRTVRYQCMAQDPRVPITSPQERSAPAVPPPPAAAGAPKVPDHPSAKVDAEPDRAPIESVSQKAPAPAMPPPAWRTSPDVAPAGGCVKDTDCKGDRVCNHGQCEEPAQRK